VEAPDEPTFSAGIGGPESVLAGCGAFPATTTSSATPTVAPTTLPRSPAVPSPTPTTDRDPFQVNFLQHYQVITCPAEPNPTNLCYTLQMIPAILPLGQSHLLVQISSMYCQKAPVVARLSAMGH